MENRIAERRKALSMTQGELAKAIHLSPSTVSRYESDSIDRIPYAHAKALADVLGCSADWLMRGKDTDEDTVDDLIEMEVELHKRFAQLPTKQQKAVLLIVRAMT